MRPPVGGRGQRLDSAGVFEAQPHDGAGVDNGQHPIGDAGRVRILVVERVEAGPEVRSFRGAGGGPVRPLGAVVVWVAPDGRKCRPCGAPAANEHLAAAGDLVGHRRAREGSERRVRTHGWPARGVRP